MKTWIRTAVVASVFASFGVMIGQAFVADAAERTYTKAEVYDLTRRADNDGFERAIKAVDDKVEAIEDVHVRIRLRGVLVDVLIDDLRAMMRRFEERDHPRAEGDVEATDVPSKEDSR